MPTLHRTMDTIVVAVVFSYIFLRLKCSNQPLRSDLSLFHDCHSNEDIERTINDQLNELKKKIPGISNSFHVFHHFKDNIDIAKYFIHPSIKSMIVRYALRLGRCWCSSFKLYPFYPLLFFHHQ